MALSKEYWDGYRDARIAVLMEGLERTTIAGMDPSQYTNGFVHGCESMHIQLMRMLKRNNKGIVGRNEEEGSTDQTRAIAIEAWNRRAAYDGTKIKD